MPGKDRPTEKCTKARKKVCLYQHDSAPIFYQLCGLIRNLSHAKVLSGRIYLDHSSQNIGIILQGRASIYESLGIEIRVIELA